MITPAVVFDDPVVSVYRKCRALCSLEVKPLWLYLIDVLIVVSAQNRAFCVPCVSNPSGCCSQVHELLVILVVAHFFLRFSMYDLNVQRHLLTSTVNNVSSGIVKQLRSLESILTCGTSDCFWSPILSLSPYCLVAVIFVRSVTGHGCIEEGSRSKERRA